jgi:hypothetical protein
VRGLKSTSPELSLPVADDRLARVWEAMSVPARERVLRVLASVIGRAVSDRESDQ